MTIEEMLSQLETEKSVLEDQYCDLHCKLLSLETEIEKHHKYFINWRRDDYLFLNEVPEELRRDHHLCKLEHMCVEMKLNRIRSAIKVIKERVGG